MKWLKKKKLLWVHFCVPISVDIAPDVAALGIPFNNDKSFDKLFFY